MCYGLFIFMAARILLPYDDFFADKLPLVYAVALVLGILTVWLFYMRDAGKFSRKKCFLLKANPHRQSNKKDRTWQSRFGLFLDTFGLMC